MKMSGARQDGNVPDSEARNVASGQGRNSLNFSWFAAQICVKFTTRSVLAFKPPFPHSLRRGPQLFHHQKRQIPGLPPRRLPAAHSAFQSQGHPPGLSDPSVPKEGVFLLPRGSAAPASCPLWRVYSIGHSLFWFLSMCLKTCS